MALPRKEALQREWDFLVQKLPSLTPDERVAALKRLRRLSDELARIEQVERLGSSR